MKTFEEAVHAMIDAQRDAGHIGEDAPDWGQYEVMLRAALLVVKQNLSGAICGHAIDAVLNGKE